MVAATPDLTVIDGIPPTFVASYYNTGTGVLNMTFSEPLNGDAIRYGSIAVRNTGESSGGLSLGAVTTRAIDSSNTTLTLTLSDDQRQQVNAMASPELDITADAVADPSNNGISAAPDQSITVIDGIRPTVTSTAYNTGTGILDITFSEPLDPTVTYSGIELAGENGNVALDDVSTKSHSGETITATLNSTQRTTVGDTMTLSVSAGAVADPSDNDIAQTTIPVDVTDGIPPTLVSSSYNTGTGILDITFSEPLDPTVTYSGIELAGENGNVALDDVSTKSHSGETITATLNSTQRTTVGDTMTLSVSAGAVADPSDNDIAQTTIPVDVTDGIPPTLVSSSYRTSTGILNITFSEPLDPTAIHYDRLHIRDAGESSGGLSLGDVTTRALDSSMTTITLTLSSTQLEDVNAMATPQLDVEAGAVADPTGNGIATAPNLSVTVIDETPPVLLSASYNIDTGILNITFSESLDHAATDYSGLTVVGQPGNVTLNQVTTKTPAVNTIWATLNATQMETTGTAPTLAIGEGAVRDPAGNGILQATGTIHITMLGSPLTEIRPVASLTDNSDTVQLDGAYRWDLFEIDGNIYGIIGLYHDNGIQIVNLTNPANPQALAHIKDGTNTELESAIHPKVFRSGSHTYTIVTGYHDDGIQIVNLTNPANPQALARIQDDTNTELDGAKSVDLFTIHERAYAIVTASDDDGIQIINITDPASPTALGHIDDDVPVTTNLNGASGVAVFEIEGNIYAIVTASSDDGIQIIDISDPNNPVAVARLGGGLHGAWDVDTFTIAGRTYAIVSALHGDGIQIIDISDPNNPVAVARLGDGGNTELDGAGHLSAFKMNGRTYALVGAIWGNAIQLIDITDPNNPTPTTNLRDSVTLKLESAREPKIFKVDGRTYALVPSFSGNGIQILRLLTVAELPPVFVSATYNTGTGILNITFNKPLDPTTIHYDRLHIRDTGDSSGGLSLGAVTTRAIDSSNTTLTLTLSDDQRQQVNAMASPELDITADAVADPSNKGVVAAPDQSITVIDGIRPTIQSTYYNTDGLLYIRFSEPLNHAATDYTKLTVAGQSGNVTLDQVADKTGAGNTIRATLNAAQVATIDTAATLHIGEGAVRDPTGNGILQATETIVVTVLGPPLTEIRPVASLADDATTELDGAYRWDLFEIDGNIYGIIGGYIDDGIQIVNLTNPASPQALARIEDDTNTELDGAIHPKVFRSGSHTYAIVTGYVDDGIQIVNLTNPASPQALARIQDDTNTELDGARNVDLFTIHERAYAIVTAYTDHGIQIINVTDPASPTALGHIGDDPNITTCSGTRRSRL